MIGLDENPPLDQAANCLFHEFLFPPKEFDCIPFLRCAEPEVVRSAQAQGARDTSPLAVLTALREWKNRA